MRRSHAGWIASWSLFLGAAGLCASPWAIVSTLTNKTAYTVDLGVSPPAVYGPFLGPGVVFVGAGVVRVVPDRSTAILADAFTGTLHVLDLTYPTAVIETGFINCCRFQIYDLRISPDGRFAVVVGHQGFSVVNLATRASTTRGTFTDRTAAAVSPDSATVITADETIASLVYGPVNSSLTDLQSESLFPGIPNVRSLIVAADNQTLLAAGGDVAVLRFATGALVTGVPPTIPSLGARTLVGEGSGNRVFLLSFGSISVLRVDAPGSTSLAARDVVTFPSSMNGIAGADLAITPDGSRLLAVDGLTNVLYVIRTSDWTITSVPMGNAPLFAVASFAAQSVDRVPTLSSGWLWALALIVATAAIWLLRR